MTLLFYQRQELTATSGLVKKAASMFLYGLLWKKIESYVLLNMSQILSMGSDFFALFSSGVGETVDLPEILLRNQ